MGKIHQLAPELVNKIAAGEVVERPASVVKELVENSLDAGATRIELRLKEGGLQLIEVLDNGEGMGIEDLRLALVPHATSKINSLEDLFQVSSFGFRGEALASIAAVSHCTLQSRLAKMTLGNLLRRGAGEEELLSCGMEVGTLVRVEDLFAKVPARCKFMKTATTEFAHVVDVVTGLALAHPTVEWLLIHNGREFLHLSPSTSRTERVQELLGRDVAEKLLPLTLKEPHFKLEGFVSRPELTTTRPDKQYLFVNGRRIQNSLLSSAVKKAYGTLLMPRSFPLFVLFLELPQDLVDVNVHPRKTEVAFVNPGAIYNFVLRAVAQVLGATDLTYGRAEFTFARRAELGGTKGPREMRAMREMSVGRGKREIPELWELGERGEALEVREMREVLQIHTTYLLQESARGVLLVDQHAAHERILYEKFLQAFQEQSTLPQSQRLLVPLPLRLSPSKQATFKIHQTTLEKVGFIFEGFTITGVPIPIKQKDISALLQEFLDDLDHEEGVREIDDASLRALTYLACRSAVKAGDPLTPLERQSILVDLSKCTVPYTCPHGRPVSIEVSLPELDKMFKRVL